MLTLEMFLPNLFGISYSNKVHKISHYIEHRGKPRTFIHGLSTIVLKHVYWRKGRLLNKQCWENCTFTCRRMKWDCHFSLITNINLKWRKASNVRLEIMKLLDKNVSGNILGHWNDRFFFFEQYSPKAQETKRKAGKYNTTLKSFYIAKETINRKEAAYSMGRYFFS